MQELLKNKKVWVVLGLFVVLIVILLFALQQCSRDGAKDTKPVKVAADFKRDYATWSDLKLNGDICKDSYLMDLRKVEANFIAVYAKAKKPGVWDGLSKQDRNIYTAYGEVGSELKVMNDAIEARDYKKAQTVLTGILEIEKNVKKENSI
ncbi:hypothetical protein [Paenilisteria newyorkensis]|uniref:hypothetical protein n=1 Tax=Listeria newyorkensis TaxID=1497681 RepID=UPI000669FF67|nr:hypothetical protein [Listeria newyorkensis]KMT61607.1 hypothetical protein X559_2046 [Listeria newyorkensis]